MSLSQAQILSQEICHLAFRNKDFSMKLERIAKEMMRSLYQMQNTNRNVYDYFETFSGRLSDWEVPQVTSDFDVALEDLEVMVEEFRDIL